MSLFCLKYTTTRCKQFPQFHFQIPPEDAFNVSTSIKRSVFCFFYAFEKLHNNRPRQMIPHNVQLLMHRDLRYALLKIIEHITLSMCMNVYRHEFLNRLLWAGGDFGLNSFCLLRGGSPAILWRNRNSPKMPWHRPFVFQDFSWLSVSVFLDTVSSFVSFGFPFWFLNIAWVFSVLKNGNSRDCK